MLATVAPEASASARQTASVERGAEQDASVGREHFGEDVGARPKVGRSEVGQGSRELLPRRAGDPAGHGERPVAE